MTTTAEAPLTSRPATGKPTLPDGLVVVVKEDCATCRMVAPVLAELVDGPDRLTIFTQDDPTFPPGVDRHPRRRPGAQLAPRHRDRADAPAGSTAARGARAPSAGTEGVGRPSPASPGLGDGPARVPARAAARCRSTPNLVDELRVRFSGSVLHSRRVELADLEDEMEAMFDRGWTDGLPVVPPTEARVLRMLEGTTRAPDEIVAVVPPDLVPVTVEKVAINAVMAGCKPEYLPVVLAASRPPAPTSSTSTACSPPRCRSGPVVIVNGPIRRAIGMNSGVNAFGQGNRANATIGRALQLVVRNVGGGRPGEVDRATLGNPGKLSFCFAEDEEGSPWEPFSVGRGARAGGQHHHPVRRRRRPLRRRPEVADTRVARRVDGRLPAHRPPPEAAARLRRHPGRVARARPGVRRGAAGRGPSSRRS